jgi:hypothetical protein
VETDFVAKFFFLWKLCGKNRPLQKLHTCNFEELIRENDFSLICPRSLTTLKIRPDLLPLFVERKFERVIHTSVALAAINKQLLVGFHLIQIENQDEVLDLVGGYGCRFYGSVLVE